MLKFYFSVLPFLFEQLQAKHIDSSNNKSNDTMLVIKHVL